MNDDQVSINGLVMGAGTSYSLVSFNPWESPEVRTSDMPRGPLPGIVAGNDLYASRRITASVIVQGTDKADALSKLQALQAAWTTSQTDIELHYQLAGTEYLYYGRARGATVKGTGMWGRGILSAECRFIATDPYYYEASRHDTGVKRGFGGSAAGLDLDPAMTFPLDFGGVLYDGLVEIEVTAPGPVPWDFEVTYVSSTSNLTFEHLEQGKAMIFNPTGTYSSTHTTPLTFDGRTRIFKYGSSEMAYAMSAGSQWYWLLPGTNTIRFTATPRGAEPAPRFRIYHRNAYI